MVVLFNITIGGVICLVLYVQKLQTHYSHTMKIHSSNTSGTGGITYRKDSNKWRARIMVDGKQIDLWTFKEKDEAIYARLKAEIEF